MTSPARKARGMRTQLVVTRALAQLWPHAASAGAGRSGTDVLNTPGIAVEVKARAGFDPLAWVKQAVSAAQPGDLPAVVFRCNGQGEATADDWPCIVRFGDFIDLLQRAGYGDASTTQGEDMAIDSPHKSARERKPSERTPLSLFVEWHEWLRKVGRTELATLPTSFQDAVRLAMTLGYSVSVRHHPSAEVYTMRATRAPGTTVFYTERPHPRSCTYSTSKYGSSTAFDAADLGTVLRDLKTARVAA